MSLSHETLLELMAYADGELEGGDRARVEALLGQSAEARQVVAGISGAESAAVGHWLRNSQEQKATAAGIDALANSVMAQVGGVVRSNAARTRRRAIAKIGGGIAAALAMAASVILLLGHRPPVGAAGHEPLARQTESARPSSDPATNAPGADPALSTNDETASETAPAAAGLPPEVNVESTTSHDVSVFVIPAVAGAAANVGGAASVIVWISDESSGQGTSQ